MGGGNFQGLLFLLRGFPPEFFIHLNRSFTVKKKTLYRLRRETGLHPFVRNLNSVQIANIRQKKGQNRSAKRH